VGGEAEEEKERSEGLRRISKEGCFPKPRQRDLQTAKLEEERKASPAGLRKFAM